MDIFSFDWLPSGGWGAFWLFLLPIGPGTTAGILVGKNGGLGAPAIAAIYLASDVVTALLVEPLLRLADRVGPRFAWTRVLARQISALVARTRLGSNRVGQFGGLALLSLGTGFLTAAAALPCSRLSRFLGWIGVIFGDMVWFSFMLAAALGLAGVLPDDRLVFLTVFVLALLVGPAVRRLQRWSEAFRPGPRASGADPT